MKKWKSEYFLYLFLVISPFLDAASYWIREFFPNLVLSPITILRLVIPAILCFHLFIKDKKARKTILLGGFLYFFYALIHLLLYVHFKTGSAYGSVLHEAQYLLNYTYMILLFYLFFYYAQEKKLKNLPFWITLFLAGYLFLLYLALITGSSSPTYIDGVGYKGWNASGNAVGSILLISLILVFPFVMKEKKWYYYFLVILTGVYLMVFLGTRVGLLGFPVVLVSYFFCCFLTKTKFDFSWKKIIVRLFMVLILLGVFFVLLTHSSTLKRQKNLEKEQNQVVDEETDRISSITGDALAYVKEIEDGTMSFDFMDQAQQQSLVEMKVQAEKWKLENKNRRLQQLLYHTYLIKNQKSISRILFGNGYLSNYSEMVLEVELVSLLYNFGIIGWVLYLGIFIIIEFKTLSFSFKNWKDKSKIPFFYLFGVFFVYGLSFMAGYTFFHVSSMMLIVLLHLFLLEVFQDKIYRKEM